jgi:hypothetical protein
MLLAILAWLARYNIVVRIMTKSVGGMWVSSHDHKEHLTLAQDVPGTESSKHATDVSWLAMVRQRLIACTAQRVQSDEIDVLCFCLQQLFLCLDSLHQLDMPDLTEQADSRYYALHLMTHYTIWTRLLKMKRVLERLEFLCQLLLGTVSTVLEALDRTCETTGYQPSSPMPDGASKQGTRQLPLLAAAEEQWKFAMAALSERLATWQTCASSRFSFAKHLSASNAQVPSPAQMDTALALLLASASAIFVEVLPTFQALAAGDDEAFAALLLELMQRADQAITQNDMLLEVLPFVIKQYALVGEIH